MTFEIYSQPTISEYYKTEEVYDTPKPESDYDNLEISQESHNYNSLTTLNLKKNKKIKIFFLSILNNKRKSILCLISLFILVILIIVGVTLAVLALTGVLTKTESSTTKASGMHNKSFLSIFKA